MIKGRILEELAQESLDTPVETNDESALRGISL
jgi:hypothetical protein